jgi:hypothetical protein
MVFGWVACVLGLLRVRRSMEAQKAQEELLDQVRINFFYFLALFYTRGYGIDVLHVMVPQPYRFSLCFLT